MMSEIKDIAPKEEETPPSEGAAAEESGDAPEQEAKKAVPTLQRKPSKGEMIKPGEMIDIRGSEALSLKDKKVWNQLLANAHGPEMALEDKDFQIPISTIRGSHKHNERVSDTILKLMKTICETTTPEGKVVRFALLGGNNMNEKDRENGLLTYRFDRDLIRVVKESFTFGKLELAVMMAFTSKYALSLWEYGAKRVRLKHRSCEEHSLEEFRSILGVEKGKLEEWADLRRRAVVPALEEINALAAFEISAEPVKTVRRVTGVRVHWKWKDNAARAEAMQELGRSRVGRKARIRGEVETLAA